MQLYALEDPFPLDLPDKAILEPYLGPLITCDPADTWRTSCRAPSTPFTVGSFGYIRTNGGREVDSIWQADCRLDGLREPILASVFYTSELPQINAEPPLIPTSEVQSYAMPDRALTLWSDGQVKLSSLAGRTPGELFTWSSFFFQLRAGG